MWGIMSPRISDRSNEPLRSECKPQASCAVARRQARGQDGSGGLSDALHGTLGYLLPSPLGAAVCGENLQGTEDFGGASAHAVCTAP